MIGGKDGGELGQGPRADVLSDEKVEARARSGIHLVFLASVVGYSAHAEPTSFYLTTSGLFALSSPKATRRRKMGRSDSICSMGGSI